MQLCVFDLDGTLINSITDIAAAMNAALVKYGYKKYKTEEYYDMVGSGMRILCARAVQNNSVKTGAEVEEVEAAYRCLYLENCCKYTTIYPGILSCLEQLKSDGVCLGVISNKPQEQTEKIITKLFPPALFSFVQGQQTGIRRKPYPDALEEKLKQMCLPRENVIYIGDSEVDIQFAKNAKVESISVLWGFRTMEVLQKAGAKFFAKNPDNLYQFIRKIQNGKK